MSKKVLIAITIIGMSVFLQIVPTHRTEPLLSNEQCPRVDHSIYPIKSSENGFEISLSSKGFPLKYYNETQSNYCETSSHITANTNVLLLSLNILAINTLLLCLLYYLPKIGD